MSFLSQASVKYALGDFFLSVMESFYLDGGCIVDSWCEI